MLTSPIYMLAFLAMFIVAFYVLAESIQFFYDQIIEQFAILANILKLKLTVPTRKRFSLSSRYPVVNGNYLNRNVNISTKEVLIGGAAFPQTQIVLDVMHYGKTFTIGSETIYSTLKKLWGHTDVSVNDPTFDRMFYITTNDPKFVQKLLDREIRDVMKENTYFQQGKFILEQAQLKYVEQISLITVHRRKRMEKVLLVMYMMAKKIDLMNEEAVKSLQR